MSLGVVLADDHRIVLDGLAQLLALEPDCQVLARCVTGSEALAAVRRHGPDVLVLDVRMPEGDGLWVLREMARESLSTPVVLLTAGIEEDEFLEAMRLGLKGLILKEMASQLLVQCVRRVAAGGEYLERDTVTRALGRVLEREVAQREILRLLTPRERELVALVSRGHPNKEIARRLNITEGTVKLHLHNVYEKLGVKGRLELALQARAHGLG